MKNVKSPFEIRADLLKMAQDYLQAQHDLNMEFAKKTFSEMVAAGKETQENIAKYLPKMYDFADITKKANELYGFVTKKD